MKNMIKELPPSPLEYDNFYLDYCLHPELTAWFDPLGYRMRWEDDFLQIPAGSEHSETCDCLRRSQCGSQGEIDLKNPETNRTSAGFTAEERAKFTKLLEAGFIDTFRYFYPDRADAYTWWSNFFNARERNIGWRIDYFLVSRELEGKLVDAKIHDQVFGSDHCPVELELELTV